MPRAKALREASSWRASQRARDRANQILVNQGWDVIVMQYVESDILWFKNNLENHLDSNRPVTKRALKELGLDVIKNTLYTRSIQWMTETERLLHDERIKASINAKAHAQRLISASTNSDYKTSLSANKMGQAWVKNNPVRAYLNRAVALSWLSLEKELVAYAMQVEKTLGKMNNVN